MSRRFGLLFPPFFWLGLFFLVPLLFILAASLASSGELGGLRPDFTVQHYREVFNPIYMKVFLKSILTAGWATLLTLILAFPMAYGMAFAPARWKPILLFLMALPFFTNLMIRLYAMTVLLGEHGWISSWIQQLGGGSLQLAHSATAVYLGFVYWNLPFLVFPLYASLERLDRSQLEASMDLGAGPVRTFWNITFPHALPGLFAGCVFCFVPTLGCYIIPEVLGGKSEILIGNIITAQFTSVRNWPLGSALSTVLIALLLLVIVLYLRYGDREGPIHG